MNKRTYYKIDIELLSPLSVGSGANTQTDKDIIVDGSGNPFIPATAIAGVLRSYITKKDEKTAAGVPLAHALFGYVPSKILSDEEKKKAENLEMPSCIRVYDACCTDDTKKVFITTRDCVKLENKLAVEGAKFDMEAVETGEKFTGYIELLSDEELYTNLIEEALTALNNSKIRIGSKTSRGYGRVKLNVKKREIFDVNEWLNFKMFEDEHWSDENTAILDLNKRIKAFELIIQLKSVGGISVRKYTTDIGEDDETMPDYQSLSLYSKEENGEPIPVIPGTSWAGAFRSRFGELVGEDTIKAVFGDVDQKTNAIQKSKITFSESTLSGGTYKISTRNAIDRFSGATKSGALYTEKTYYYGKTDLEISFENNPDTKTLWALGVCLADLHNGFLAVGGLTSVGRGLFKIDSLKLNGNTLNLENIINGEIDKFVKEVSNR